jgi:hypothetical protein
MGKVDFGHLRGAIKDAARSAFDGARAALSGERLYAFGLASDDGADIIWPAVNTEEGYERCVQRYQTNESFMQDIASWGVPFSSYRDIFRWSIGEWAGLNAGKDYFSGVGAMLKAGEGNDEGPDGFAGYQGGVFAAMVLGLRDLDAAGYFGVGDDRERVTLLCSLVDSSSAVWMEEASVRLLNSCAVFERFWNQWSAWPATAEKFGRHAVNPSRVYRAFVRHLEASN